MTLTKAQRAVLAEMARTGLPLAYHGGICKVGEKVTTVPLRRALLDAGMVCAADDPEGALPVLYNTPLALTDAGRTEGERELAATGGAPFGWVRFGEVARDRCGEEAQYAARAIDGRCDYPHLGAGLRFRGDPRNWHFVLIHADDVEAFVQRWNANKEQGR